MASVSGTSSLGNTSLRGYGGFASGIDRDAIIEQMTLGTQSKITRQKNSMTKITWKQESYQSMSSKMIELQDNYFSFSSGINLKYASAFAKNKVSVLGDEDSTKFITASGTSSMTDYLSILGVKQIAKQATLRSSSKNTTTSVTTSITASKLDDVTQRTTKLDGTQLKFGTYDASGKFQSAGTFTFPTSYTRKDSSGKNVKVYLDYTADMDARTTISADDLKQLVGDNWTPPAGSDYPVNPEDMTNGQVLALQLNRALEGTGIKNGSTDLSDEIQFKYDAAKKTMSFTGSTSLVINSSSSALSALGFNSKKSDNTTEKDTSDGITIAEFNENQLKYEDSAVAKKDMVEYLKGKTFTINFGGKSKQIELIKNTDTITKGSNGKYNPEDLEKLIQKNIDTAFGKDNIVVQFPRQSDGVTVDGSGKLEFKLGSNASANQSFSISSDNEEVRNNIGIIKGASNKISLQGSIKDNIDKLIPNQANQQAFLTDLATNGLVINGVKISGVTADTSISDMMEKINSNKDVGVKATYLESTNEFVLMANETGKGREFDLGVTGSAADTIFGSSVDSNGVYTGFTKGENAEIIVSYGNGVTTTVESTSNTFNLEGLSITVSGEFGVKQDGTTDPSQAVTFSAKADVEGVTEKIKKFMEEYNALVKEINTQKRTKPSSYEPLSEEQKKEMSETSIENWEKKAKEGLLYSDSIVRDLSNDMQNVLTVLTSGGVTYEDLKEIGITFSEDLQDGGTLSFDEVAFKEAMSKKPDKVSDIFTGGGDVTKGLSQVIEDTLTPYATRYSSRNKGSNGRLIDEAGSDKLPSSLNSNKIYNDLQDMQKELEKLQERLTTEQDRYISQFTTMETLISQMNSQSSWLGQFSS